MSRCCRRNKNPSTVCPSYSLANGAVGCRACQPFHLNIYPVCIQSSRSSVNPFWRTHTSSNLTNPSQVLTASRRGPAALGAHFAWTRRERLFVYCPPLRVPGLTFFPKTLHGSIRRLCTSHRTSYQRSWRHRVRFTRPYRVSIRHSHLLSTV